jgi:hypothetical protein
MAQRGMLPTCRTTSLDRRNYGCRQIRRHIVHKPRTVHFLTTLRLLDFAFGQNKKSIVESYRSRSRVSSQKRPLISNASVPGTLSLYINRIYHRQSLRTGNPQIAVPI